MRAYEPGAPARDGPRSADRARPAIGGTTSSGIAARSAAALCRPSPGRWPSSTGLFAAFCGAAATTMVAVPVGGTRQQDASLAALAALSAVIAALSVPLAAPGIGAIAWMFDNGFLVNRHADLIWHGTADGIRLGVLLGAAVAGAVLGWATVRAQSSCTGSPPSGTGDDQAVPGPPRGIVVNLGEIRGRRAAARVSREGPSIARVPR